MTRRQARWLVYSDLDGTLLDKHSYSFAPAMPALGMLTGLSIPLILNTSKTVAEVIALRNQLHNHHPFICENGGVLVLPDSYFSQPPQSAKPHPEITGYRQLIPGHNYAEILQVLSEAATQGFNFRGFSQLSDPELASLCEFTEQDAVMAKQRSASEPIQWLDSEAQLVSFQQWLKPHQLTLVKGGRFHHVMGAQSKGQAMDQLTTVYEQQHGLKFNTLALGDSENDLSMLQRADVAIVIATEQGHLRLNNHPNSFYPSEIGPAGWNEAVLNWINRDLEI